MGVLWAKVVSLPSLFSVDGESLLVACRSGFLVLDSGFFSGQMMTAEARLGD
jgi:hypothetical protein